MGWWLRYLDWRQRNVWRLASDGDGFSVHNRGHSTCRAWRDIVSVTAFKRDLMTVDMLCLLIESPAGVIEVNEGMVGYPRFENDLGHALDIDPLWKGDVLFPAFATNATRIFPRADPA